MIQLKMADAQKGTFAVKVGLLRIDVVYTFQSCTIYAAGLRVRALVWFGSRPLFQPVLLSWRLCTILHLSCEVAFLLSRAGEICGCRVGFSYRSATRGKLATPSKSDTL